MTHDLEDLLELIIKLELRIIELEKMYSDMYEIELNPSDSYYWEHG